MLMRVFGTILKISRPNFFGFIISKRNAHKTHYDILGVPKNCSRKDIKDAFIKLSKIYHPDANKHTASNQHFVKLNEAYNILGKAESRRRYDLELMHASTVTAGDLRKTMKHKGRTRPYGFDEPNYTYRRPYSERYYGNDNYYGVHGVKRVSNGTVALLCVAFTFIGATIQFYIISFRRRRPDSYQPLQRSS